MSVTSGVGELFLLSPSISVPPFSASAGPVDKVVLCSHNVETKEFYAPHPCRQPPSLCSHSPPIFQSFCDSPSTPSCLASSPPSPHPPLSPVLLKDGRRGRQFIIRMGRVCVYVGGGGLRMPGAACATLYIVCICVCLCLPCGYYPIFSFV